MRWLLIALKQIWQAWSWSKPKVKEPIPFGDPGAFNGIESLAPGMWKMKRTRNIKKLRKSKSKIFRSDR